MMPGKKILLVSTLPLLLACDNGADDGLMEARDMACETGFLVPVKNSIARAVNAKVGEVYRGGDCVRSVKLYVLHDTHAVCREALNAERTVDAIVVGLCGPCPEVLIDRSICTAR